MCVSFEIFKSGRAGKPIFAEKYEFQLASYLVQNGDFVTRFNKYE